MFLTLELADLLEILQDPGDCFVVVSEPLWPALDLVWVGKEKTVVVRNDSRYDISWVEIRQPVRDFLPSRRRVL